MNVRNHLININMALATLMGMTIVGLAIGLSIFLVTDIQAKRDEIAKVVSMAETAQFRANQLDHTVDEMREQSVNMRQHLLQMRLARGKLLSDLNSLVSYIHQLEPVVKSCGQFPKPTVPLPSEAESINPHAQLSTAKPSPLLPRGIHADDDDLDFIIPREVPYRD